MRGSILVKVRGGQVEVFLNCDTYELETVLAPAVDEIKSVVEEALIPADGLVADVAS